MRKEYYTHCVVDDHELIYRIGNARLQRRAAARRAIDLIAIGEQEGINSFWIAPQSELSDILPADFYQGLEEAGYIVSPYEYEGGKGDIPRVMRLNVYRKGEESTFFTFPKWDSYWSIKEGDALSMLAAIHYCGRVLPLVNIASGPGTAGRGFIIKLAENNTFFRPLSMDIDTLPYQETGVGLDLGWKQEKQIEYMPGQYVYGYDKNSMYLGAATGTKLGAGDPVYVKGGRDFKPNVKQPGIWHVRIQPGAARYTGYDLPYPFVEDQEYLTSPLLELAYDLHFDIEVLDGWQWEESHRTLETFGKQVWDARQALNDPAVFPHEQGRKIARSMVKSIATGGLGMLDAEYTRDRKSMLPYYRPDMYRTIKELAKARMVRKVMQLENTLGITPAAISTDCMYFVSVCHDPYSAVPGLIEKSNGLGGFKVEHSLALTPQIVDELNETDSGGAFARIISDYEEKQGAAHE
jgi:hypothetical protein